MDTDQREAAHHATEDHLWECPACEALYPSIWLARECHDATFERNWR